MVDLKRGACASALLFLIAVSPPVSPESQSTPLAPAAPSEPQESPPKPRGETFAPSSIEGARPSLPELTTTQPIPRDPATKALERQTPEDTSAEALPPPDSAQSDNDPPLATDPRRQEARLHTGLSWDYCGPRPGASQSDVLAQPNSAADLPIDITADRVDYDRESDLIQLRGNIEILQDNRRLEADQSSYNRRSDRVEAAGRIYLEHPGIRLTGDSIDYNLETKQGTIDKVRYRVSGNANLRGEADQAWMLSEQLSRYRDIIYTTCPPGYSDWSIQARDLELDQASGIGTARHARIRIGDIPVLYSPYLRFPIDDRRRSGLLIPSFGSSDETGTDISLPYYWNIAPNMDATLIPRFMSTRGLMLGAQFRHLASFQALEVDTEILPSDRKAKEEGVRGALRVKQTGQISPRWASSVDYALVSDDQYLQDFGNRLDVTSIRNLSQRGDLNYGGDGWRLLSRIQEFQTVDASIAPADRPYGQLPHIELEMDPKIWNPWGWNQGVEYSLKGQYDYFEHNAAVHGNRLVAVPSARIPLRRGFGYLIPSARLYYTSYDLIDQTPGLPDQPSHLIPSLDIDGKLIFERETNWLGRSAMQTLEPRIYYLLTAFEDQSDTPLFDTTALDFSFASLFRPSSFTGYDRIGDENRLTVGLTSRTIANRTGQELFRASLGQIYYFDQRRVQLSGSEVDTDISSSVAGEFSVRPHPDWRARISTQWNPNQTQQPWEKQVLELRYIPDNEHLLNLAYRYNLGDQESEQYEDTDISFQMPLGSRVRVVGRWLYSMLNDQTVEAFAGIEFGRCCWRVRLLGQHLKRSADTAGSTSIMLQLELAGLGSFGNSVDKLLERGIYGYQTD